jgi:hypothetical protein
MDISESLIYMQDATGIPRRQLLLDEAHSLDFMSGYYKIDPA